MKAQIQDIIQASISVKQQVLADPGLQDTLLRVIDTVSEAFGKGNKVWFCGNGGSAADAQHLAAEFSGRFYKDRKALPSEALHCNTSYLTAVANDYSYEDIYSRLIDGVGQPGDVLIGLSTSGNSPNVVKAFVTARGKGIITIGFTGMGGGAMKEYSDLLIEIPSRDTPRIQEAHMLLGHIVCQLVEQAIFPE